MLRKGKSRFFNDTIVSRRNCSKIYNNERLTGFPVNFKPKDVEKGWYNTWESNNFFIRKHKNDGKVFSMILPPPNVTGTLHLGHALTTTVQDVLARWHIMQGIPVKWIPGLDHASIATQTVVEKYLYRKRNIRRTDLSKQEFLKIVDCWKNEKSDVIRHQLKRLGASLDWPSEYFTMDQHHSKAVTKAFSLLNEKNLVYRDKLLVNWSPTLGSAISDIEVEFDTVTEKTDFEVPGYSKKITFGQIYEVAYDIFSSDSKIIVATTRPETIFGDVAIAVHPDDERYAHLKDKRVVNPLNGSHMPIVFDSSVTMDFGTGAVKITPAHDEFDYKVANSHKLQLIEVIDDKGNMKEIAGEYRGLSRFEVRKQVLDVLANKGALISIKDHKQYIPRCSRTKDIVELMLKDQWFIKCKTMAEKACQAVEDGSLKLDPEFHKDRWFEWLGNVRDWCVSRQLCWGHPIPAYHYEIDSKQYWIITDSFEDALNQVIKKHGEEVKITQDKDVLDTWFSSALLPFSALGWPEQTENLQNYYPLSLMESGHDILYFWIARMVMLGLELTGKLPFKEVLLHGLLSNAQGKKMSKSSGNVIYPENVIEGISLEDLNSQTQETFETGILNQKELRKTLAMNTKMFPNGIPESGVDALRFTLCSHNFKERTVTFDVDEFEQARFFCNKILQASKYALLMTSDKSIETPKTLTLLDQWILSRLCWMVDTVDQNLREKYFNKATRAIKEFLYYEFCDYYVEGTKLGFQSLNADTVNSHRYTLVKCLETSLRILAPITPYFSDDLYSKLAEKLPAFNFEKSLLQKSYPSVSDLQEFRNEKLEDDMREVMKVILSIRALVGNISKKSISKAHIVAESTNEAKLYEISLNTIVAVSKVHDVGIFVREKYIPSRNSVCDNFGLNCSVYLVIGDEEVFEKVKMNINNKRAKAQKKLDELIRETSKEKYISNVPDVIKIKNQQKIQYLQDQLKAMPMNL